MIRWNLKRLNGYLKRYNIANPSQLAGFVGLTKPTAAKVLNGDPLEKIDARTLESVCRAFRTTPGVLLEIDPPIPDIQR